MALRFGVEEEYFVVDPMSRRVVPRAPAVVARASAGLGDRVSTELVASSAEAKTSPCDDLTKLDEQIRSMRATMASAAATENTLLVATGTPVLGDPIPPPISQGPRYADSLAHYRALDDDMSICSCHVHVGIADRALAVEVSNHLRPWLPTLLALSANSPYWAGRDTGHVCWRVMAWARWPVAGPPPCFRSLAHFDETVEKLLDCGALMDPATLFWDVRPSTRFPTIEIRLADVALTADDAVLFAALVRALVQQSVTAIEGNAPTPDPQPEILRAAYWLAARDGLSGKGINPFTGKPAAQRDLATALLTHVHDALEDNGDLDYATTGLRRLLTTGTGADHQRAAYRHRERLTDVVDQAALTP
ncbi:glutamate--cysteine ligase [Spirillospora sp. NPDC048911]|uniref:carboxylate-amine ligase n=1 Tax=Spirillospora sp. NPDC048911 TaxID=3364527 RepID=UPI00371B6A30